MFPELGIQKLRSIYNDQFSEDGDVSDYLLPTIHIPYLDYQEKTGPLSLVVTSCQRGENFDMLGFKIRTLALGGSLYHLAVLIPKEDPNFKIVQGTVANLKNHIGTEYSHLWQDQDKTSPVLMISANDQQEAAVIFSANYYIPFKAITVNTYHEVSTYKGLVHTDMKIGALFLVMMPELEQTPIIHVC